MEIARAWKVAACIAQHRSPGQALGDMPAGVKPNRVEQGGCGRGWYSIWRVMALSVRVSTNLAPVRIACGFSKWPNHAPRRPRLMAAELSHLAVLDFHLAGTRVFDLPHKPVSMKFGRLNSPGIVSTVLESVQSRVRQPGHSRWWPP
jgi:hypothetical protein